MTLPWIGCQKLCMSYPFHTPGRVISLRDKQSHCLYITSEWVFVLEWKSRSGTVTRVNTHRFDSLWYEILCWCHVNKHRDSRGDRSELLLEWKKSRWYHVNTVLSISFEVDVPAGKVGGSLLFECRRRKLPRGVWGHASLPPKFWNLDALKCFFQRFPDSIWALRTIKIKTIIFINHILCLLQAFFSSKSQSLAFGKEWNDKSSNWFKKIHSLF